MNFKDRTQTGDTPFQNLDAVSALKEISDGAAAICSGGQRIRFGDLTVQDVNDGDGADELSLIVNGKTIWKGNDVRKGQKINLRGVNSQELNQNTMVKLVERDIFGDDTIGNFKPSEKSSPISLQGSGAKYSLGFVKF